MEIIRTLGLDIGTNSLGWCLIETRGEPGKNDTEGRIIDIGVRIFSATEMAGRDAKSQQSLAVRRRQARTMRRQRDRRLKRKKRLLSQLTEFGLMPAGREARKQLVRDTDDGAKGDLSTGIFALRARAVNKPLKPFELGRVLFHMNQHRGFKSNRKTDKRNKNESTKIETGVSRLHQAMGAMGARTYGEFLYKRRLSDETYGPKGGRLNRKSIRTRLRPETQAEFEPDKNAKGDGYDFYPDRAELEREFDTIVDAQAPHHPHLTEQTIAALRETILFQRPLLPPRVGKCSYNPDELRLPKAHPLFQEFRLYKEVNELKVTDKYERAFRLTPEQRDTLILKLRGAKKPSYKTLFKLLKLDPKYERFNKDKGARSKMEGNLVRAVLGHKTCFGPAWSTLSINEQWRIIERLLEEPDPEVLRRWLADNTQLDDEHIEAVMAAELPSGYGRLGHSAMTNLLDALKNDTDEDGNVISEAEAAINVYGRTNAEDDPNREAVALLPKYQEVLERHIPPGEGSIKNPPSPKDPGYDRHMGRITNPTVHIALNQLRLLVNALVKRYGKPDRMAVELGRELKLSDRQRDEINKDIAANTKHAQRRSAELEEMGMEDNGYNRLRLKLWEQLNEKDPSNRVCIYSGTPITKRMALSPETNVDHILPYSRTLDDGINNKLLCTIHANRQKKNRAPAEVPEWEEHYDDILTRAKNLPIGKQWRFAKDAMEQFEERGDFAARQLTDMQYASRMAAKYLQALYPAEEVDKHGELRRTARIRALPGRTTEMLRRHWKLNEILHDREFMDTTKAKNRLDHRHNAIDAAVIACTSRSLINRIAKESAEREKAGAEAVAARAPEPWKGFREDLRVAVLGDNGHAPGIVVSHKPDHGTISRAGYASGKGQTAGQLHNETAYGFTDETNEKGDRLAVRRKALDEFTKEDHLLAIRDPNLRDTLWEVTRGLSGKDFQSALVAFSNEPNWNGRDNPYKGLRHIRVLEPRKLIPIRNKTGKAYKGYMGDSNYRYDVWRLPDGKWKVEVVSTFDAHQPEWRSQIRAQYATAKKLLSLTQNDMVAYENPNSNGKSDRVIARVRKFGQTGVIFLVPHFESGPLDKRHANPKDPFRHFSKSPGTLKALKLRQVRVDVLGRVSDPGPRD